MTLRSFGSASLLVLAWLAMGTTAHAATLMGDAADSLQASVLVEDLSQPTDVAELPDGRVVITQRLGDVVVIGADGTTKTAAGHIDIVEDFQEQGLLGVVADPDFANNNILYFYASVGTDYANKHKVYKIPLGADSKLATSRDMIISMGLRSSKGDNPAGFGNHNGGGMVIFNNFLYVSVGDSGHNATPPTNHLGTCLNSPNGKILRVALDGAIPADNPLSGEAMVTGCSGWNQDLTMVAPDKRIFFWGLRNPYRFWIDSQTKRMWIGDVGESTREEVSVSGAVDGDAAEGQHFGWPFREGTTNYTTSQQSWQPANACMGVSPARECVGPVYDYQNTRGGDACVIGGLIPSGCGWEAPWTSRYFFGDNSSGKVWTLDVNGARDNVTANSRVQIASTQGIGSFRMGAKGVLYLAEVSGGVVTKITPKGYDPTMCTGSTGGTGGTGSGGAGAGGSGASGGSGATGGDGGGAPNGGTSSASGGTGTAGTSTGGGGAATGGSGQQTGGTAPTAGTAGRGGSGGGSAGTGTAGTGTAGTSPTGSGGANAAGGTTSTAGTTGAAGTGEPKDEGGCGCRVAGSGGRFGGLLAIASGLALYVLRRSRKQRRESLH